MPVIQYIYPYVLKISHYYTVGLIVHIATMENNAFGPVFQSPVKLTVCLTVG